MPYIEDPIGEVVAQLRNSRKGQIPKKMHLAVIAGSDKGDGKVLLRCTPDGGHTTMLVQMTPTQAGELVALLTRAKGSVQQT